VEEDLVYLQGFESAIEAGFLNGVPPHVADPENSAFYTMTEAQFEEKTVEEIQGIFRRKHILVTEMRSSPLEFDLDGLWTLASPWSVTDIQGMRAFLGGFQSYFAN
jgi:hypothetical protein